MHHRARDVRRRAERRVADDIEVGESGQAERVAEAAAARALDVEQQFGVAGQLDARVDRPQTRQSPARGSARRLFSPSYGDVNRPCACEMRFSWPDSHQRLSAGCGRSSRCRRGGCQERSAPSRPSGRR